MKNKFENIVPISPERGTELFEQLHRKLGHTESIDEVPPDEPATIEPTKIVIKKETISKKVKKPSKQLRTGAGAMDEWQRKKEDHEDQLLAA